jgi:hypothetical protein
MKLLAFFLVQGLHQKLDNKSYFSQRKILETPIFLDLFNERRFHLLLKFLHFVDNERVSVMKQGKTVGWPCVLNHFQQVAKRWLNVRF